MEGKKKSIAFQTKTTFFPPLKRKVNILLQRNDGPCMIIAIFNSLVLKGKVSIESGSYSLEYIISIIQSYNPSTYDLEKFADGYYVNPAFDSCSSFDDYPEFLEKLDIKLVHAMSLSKKTKNYNLISKYNYESLIAKLIELESTMPCSDELKILRAFYSKISRKQITEVGIEQIESNIKEGEVQIFFRNSHFACIYKHLNHVYSLITCRGLAGKDCVWHSLPSPNNGLQYFDKNFNLTVCKPWAEGTKEKSKQKRISSEVKAAPKSKKAKGNDCTIC